MISEAVAMILVGLVFLVLGLISDIIRLNMELKDERDKCRALRSLVTAYMDKY